MNMQLDMSEIQAAVTAYLRARGVVVENASQVNLLIVDRGGGRIEIVGCTPIVVVTNVKLPEGAPYR